VAGPAPASFDWDGVPIDSESEAARMAERAGQRQLVRKGKPCMTGHARREATEAEGVRVQLSLPDHDRVFAVLAFCIALLLLASAAVVAASRMAGAVDSPWVLLVSVNAESNIPTWFSIVLLAAGSGLAWIVRRADRTRGAGAPAPWGWIAALLAFLSLDECAGLHEAVGRNLVGLIEAEGVLYFRWVVVGAPVALAAVLVLAWLERGLPRSDRIRLATAFTIYFGGAVILEAIGGVLADDHGRRSLAAMASIHAEEGMEMLGAALIVRALLARLREVAGLARPA